MSTILHIIARAGARRPKRIANAMALCDSASPATAIASSAFVLLRPEKIVYPHPMLERSAVSTVVRLHQELYFRVAVDLKRLSP